MFVYCLFVVAYDCGRCTEALIVCLPVKYLTVKETAIILQPMNCTTVSLAFISECTIVQNC